MTRATATGGRRSWSERPRWWSRWAVLALGVFGATWVSTAAQGRDPREDAALRATLAAAASAGSLVGLRRDHRLWRQLEGEVPGGREALLDAEGVVRRGASPTSDAQRRLAVRVALLRRRELGGRWAPRLLAVVGVALLVLAVAASPWWAVLGLAAGAAAVGTSTAVVRLDRRRRQLEDVIGA
ncbi:hypothetical protein WDV85_15610 [Pseudokineococcus sp. 5B2Z-1]|uniref:hypothetical protein n=1 Tax=Pseudokineococcus sp. 5B2Z-1 TaxID=3132744 RepID=UPI0030A45E30